MAHKTATSPVLFSVTGVETPGPCEPRLNSLPGLADKILWTMLSSFTKIRVSPFFMVTALSENARPFCMIERSAANATADPVANARTSARVIGFMSLFLFVQVRPRRSARQHGNGGRVHVARQRFHECHDVGFFPVGKGQGLHQIGAARAIESAILVVVHDRLERRHGSVVHVRTPAI